MSAPTPSRNPSQPAADNIIQQAGIIVAGYSPSSADDKTRDILGALLKYAPSASGRSNVAEEIIATPSCKAFADYFVTSFLFPRMIFCLFTPPPPRHMRQWLSFQSPSEGLASVWAKISR